MQKILQHTALFFAFIFKFTVLILIIIVRYRLISRSNNFQQNIMTLTEKDAVMRYNCIKQNSISYNFHLKFHTNGYSGLSQIKFTLLAECKNLFIDCSTKKLQKLVINGQAVDSKEIRQDENHLYLNQDKIKLGENIVIVEYNNQFNIDQKGIMNFVDVDAKQYLYTSFQPYYANRVFALFDQPDLKATMVLSVICPIQWTKILSNQHPLFNEQFQQQKYLKQTPSMDKKYLIEFTECIGQKCRMGLFPVTKTMPTYLYCVMLGPFEEIQLKQLYNNIPMSLYCSATYYPYVQKMAPYLFEVTVESMKFFEKYFGVPYSFSKYDQIFVHQMESYAMENTGMVTYYDAEYIWKDQVTQEKALDLYETMAHQLAHHWFGNLVTMKWCGDLWLNQSFAQFFGYYSLQKIQKDLKLVKFESSMGQFLNKKYERAHRDDKSVTTHPVASQVQNTGQGQAIFDGITYSKGASVLLQLIHLMGDQHFSELLKHFLTKFAFKNVTYDDFAACFQIHANKTWFQQFKSSAWLQKWLKTSSLNEIHTDWKLMDNKQTVTMTVTPFCSKHTCLRPHRLKIAAFDQKCNLAKVMLIDNIPQIQGSITKQLQSITSPSAILVNYEDMTFAKTVLDPRSMQFFSHNISKINDLLARTSIWRNFYEMVADGNMPSLKFFDIFINNIALQQSDALLQLAYSFALSCLHYFTPSDYQLQLSTRLFYLTIQLIQNTKNANRLIALKQNLCELAGGKIALHLLYRWHMGLQQLGQLSLGNRWTIVRKIAQSNLFEEQNIRLMIQNMSKYQNNVLETLRCNTIMINSQQQFQKCYLSLLDHQNNLTMNTKKYIAMGLNCERHAKILKNYKKRYFDDIQSHAKQLLPQHLRVFAQLMLPQDDDLEYLIEGLKSIIIQGSKLAKVRTILIKMGQFLEKRKKAHQKFKQSFSAVNN